MQGRVVGQTLSCLQNRGYNRISGTNMEGELAVAQSQGFSSPVFLYKVQNIPKDELCHFFLRIFFVLCKNCELIVNKIQISAAKEAMFCNEIKNFF